MIITGNMYNQQNNNLLNTTTITKKKQVHFTGIQPNKSHISSNSKNVGIGVGIAGVTLLGTIGVKCKPAKKFISKKIIRPLEEKIFKNKNFQMESADFEGVNLTEHMKNKFIECFVERIKNPFTKNSTREMKSYPPNGYLLTGPDSKAKEETFNWMLEELKNAGAEIIDPGKGKKAKFDTVADAWWNMWNTHSDEQFRKTGKYKVFVVRGVDELGQPNGYPEGHFKFPDGALLKDSPDSSNSCRKHGIMLFYTCRNTSKVDPATIRQGRIDMQFSPQPKDDEPLQIWKEYLRDIKKDNNPSVIVNKLDAAKKVLTKRGEDVMKETKPYFDYMVPYISPKATDSLKKWEDYIGKQSKNPSRGVCNSQFLNDLKELQGNLLDTEKDKNKFKTILKWMGDVQKPEHKKDWDLSVKYTLEGEDPAYFL